MSSQTPILSSPSWLSMTAAHAGWVLRTTWRNGEQLLLLVGIPLAAFLALTRTDLLSTSTPPLVVTSAMIVLAAGFTSPAITIAFERRYGSFAFLGTTPLPRTSIIAGTLAATIVSAGIATAVVSLIAIAFAQEPSGSMLTLTLAVLLGLAAVVPWAFLLGGTAKSETVLVTANAIFVVAILFGGILVPSASLPYGPALTWTPAGAMVDLAANASASAVGVLIAWAAIGTVLAVRFFRWR